MTILDLKRSWIFPDQPQLGESNTRLLAKKNARVNGLVYRRETVCRKAGG